MFFRRRKFDVNRAVMNDLRMLVIETDSTERQQAAVDLVDGMRKLKVPDDKITLVKMAIQTILSLDGYATLDVIQTYETTMWSVDLMLRGI